MSDFSSRSTAAHAHATVDIDIDIDIDIDPHVPGTRSLDSDGPSRLSGPRKGEDMTHAVDPGS
jgi:hypothetical protein